MAYSKQTWNNTPSGGTPLTAPRLNHMEDGIENAGDGMVSVEPDTAERNLVVPTTDVPALTLKQRNSSDAHLLKLQDDTGADRFRFLSSRLGPTITFLGAERSWIVGMDVANTGHEGRGFVLGYNPTTGEDVIFLDDNDTDTTAVGIGNPIPDGSYRMDIAADGPNTPAMGTLALRTSPGQDAAAPLLGFTNLAGSYTYASFDIHGRLTMAPDTGGYAIKIYNGAESNPRLQIAASTGALELGPGSGITDVFLLRDETLGGAAALKISGNTWVSNFLAVGTGATSYTHTIVAKSSGTGNASLGVVTPSNGYFEVISNGSSPTVALRTGNASSLTLGTNGLTRASFAAADGVLTLTPSSTLTGAGTDLSLSIHTPAVAGSYTLDRLNYFELTQPSGAATVTDACVFRFPAAAGTHKAVDSGTTKTSPGTVSAWVKVNINGTVHYMPAYTSKTS